MNEEPYIAAWVAIGMGSLVVILVLLFGTAEAGDLRVGVFLGSQHIEESYNCDGSPRSFNEENRGAYMAYKGVMLGRYENSHSGCDGHKYSTVLAYEHPLGSSYNLDFSISAGIADGYPDDEDGWRDYQPWASINMKWNLFGSFGPKLWYAYKVSAYALEGEL